MLHWKNEDEDMIRYIKMMAGLVLCLSMLGTSMSYAATSNALETVYEHTTTEQLANGLIYEHKEKLTEAGWVDIYVMKMTLDDETINMDVVRDEMVFGQRDGLSDIVNQSTNVIGAVNASFFSMGTDISDIEGYEYYNEDYGFVKDLYNMSGVRSASLISESDGNVLFDFVESDITFKTSSGLDIYVVGVNSIGDFSNPIIFNTNAYKDTSVIDAMTDLYKVVVENDVIIDVLEPDEFGIIPENGYILVFNDSVASTVLGRLKAGTKATLDIKSNYDVSMIEMAIPGGGLILEDGIVVEEGLIVDKNSRHPRTAVGITKDKKTLITMVVDGRGKSIGATHYELASYLQEYEVSDAIHFDGGGSTTITAKQPGEFEAEAMNTPSDGYERPVVNGLGFVSIAPATSDIKVQLKASQTMSFVDNKIAIELVAYDSNYNPVAVNQGQVSWGVSGGHGLVVGNYFIPKEPGEQILTAYYKGEYAMIKLNIADELIDIEVTPKVISYEDGSRTFKVIGTDSNGYKCVIDNSLLTWRLDQAIGTIDKGVFVGTNGPASARIDVSYNTIKEVAYVVSGEKTSELFGIDQLSVESLVYPEAVVGSSQISQLDGKASIQIDYNFEKANFSQAVYAVVEGATVWNQVEQLEIEVDQYPSDISIKAHIEDGTGTQHTLTFKQYIDGYARAYIPTSLEYPLNITKIYVVNTSTDSVIGDAINIYGFKSVTKNDASDIQDIKSILPADKLYEQTPDSGFELKIIGATAGRNRLLDELVMSKAYDILNDADYAIYAGTTSVEKARVTNNYYEYSNAFDIEDMSHARIISLAMSAGSMVKTDMSQWEKLNTALSSTVQNTIIIMGTENLIDNTDNKFSNEGKLIHQTLRDFAEKSDKKIFYVNASGYTFGLDFYEGIRYIDLNGLWYKVGDDSAVDLYDSFQTLNLTFTGDDVTYRILDLYPKTTVK